MMFIIQYNVHKYRMHTDTCTCVCCVSIVVQSLYSVDVVLTVLWEAMDVKTCTCAVLHTLHACTCMCKIHVMAVTTCMQVHVPIGDLHYTYSNTTNTQNHHNANTTFVHVHNTTRRMYMYVHAAKITPDNANTYKYVCVQSMCCSEVRGQLEVVG